MAAPKTARRNVSAKVPEHEPRRVPNDIGLWRFLAALEDAIQAADKAWGYCNDGTGHAGHNATLMLMKLQHELTVGVGLEKTVVKAWVPKDQVEPADDCPF